VALTSDLLERGRQGTQAPTEQANQRGWAVRHE
jgi:hypothetical protein